MISFELLKNMCIEPDYGKAYYRPFICNGDLSKVDIFFVGINPATPIFPSEIYINEYVELLLNYDNFIDYYKTNRTGLKKNDISRTRIGMNSFFSWLSNHTECAILETDVIPYPTVNLKELKREPKYVIDKGRDIFYSLVMEFKPSLLILHGKKTVEHVNEIFIEKGLILPNEINVEQSIEEMEQQSPLMTFKYDNGKIGIIMACRHFMYYGNKGNSFKPFRQRILRYLIDFNNKIFY